MPSGKFSGDFVRSLKLRRVNGKRILLGEGCFGKVYLGDVKFQDGSKKRVAVKLYKNKIPKTTDKQILHEYNKYQQETFKRYKNVISDLSSVTIPVGLLGNKKPQSLIPKCAVFLIDGQLVFVSQAFTKQVNNRQVSKFAERTNISDVFDTIKFKEIIYSSMALISKGYNPEIDIFMKYKDRNTFMVLDFDSFVQNPRLEKPEHKISAFNNVLSEVFARTNPSQKKEIRSFMEKVIRQDKGNISDSLKESIFQSFGKS